MKIYQSKAKNTTVILFVFILLFIIHFENNQCNDIEY